MQPFIIILPVPVKLVGGGGWTGLGGGKGLIKM
jgi:hypothetical protein